MITLTATPPSASSDAIVDVSASGLITTDGAQLATEVAAIGVGGDGACRNPNRAMW